MRTKRDDIKRKYNTFFEKLAKEFNTELDISERPSITNYEDYKFDSYHNFYFNLKNGLNVYVEISDINKNIVYSAIKIDNIKQKNLANNILLYINDKLGVKYAEIIVDNNFLESIDVLEFKKNIDDKEEKEEKILEAELEE